MGDFKIYLDTVQYTDIDLEGFSIETERDLDPWSFLTKFSQKVKLYKTAYDYVKTQFEDTGGCGSIDVLIEYRCSQTDDYTELMTGVILLNEIEIDEQICKITTDIEETSVSQLFLDLMDFEVNLDADASLNGNTFGSSILKPLRNFFEEDGTLLTETNGVDYAYGYSFYNALDRVLDHITDGRLRLLSTFLNTLAVDKTWAVEMIPGPAIGQSVTFTFTNTFGTINTFTVTRTGTLADLGQKVNAELAPFGYIGAYSTGAGNISWDVLAYNVDDSLVVTTTDGTTVVDVAVVTDYIPGAKAVYLTDGKRLTNRLDSRYKPLEISFKKLFDIIGRLYDLSYNIVESGGQYYLSVERLEDSFDTVPSITLNNVPNIITQPLKERIKSSVRIGGRGTGYYFVNLTCGGTIDKGIDKLATTNPEEILSQIKGEIDNEDRLYVIEGKGLVGAYDEPKEYSFDTVGVYPAYTTTSHMNRLVEGDTSLLTFHTFFLPDEVDLGGTTTTGTPKQFIKTADFDYPLTFTEFMSIDAGTMIAFNKNSTETSREGYIYSLKYDVVRGMAHFSLLVK